MKIMKSPHVSARHRRAIMSAYFMDDSSILVLLRGHNYLPLILSNYLSHQSNENFSPVDTRPTITVISKFYPHFFQLDFLIKTISGTSFFVSNVFLCVCLCAPLAIGRCVDVCAWGVWYSNECRGGGRWLTRSSTVQLQIEEVSRKLRSGDLGIPQNVEERSVHQHLELQPLYSRHYRIKTRRDSRYTSATYHENFFCNAFSVKYFLYVLNLGGV